MIRSTTCKWFLDSFDEDPIADIKLPDPSLWISNIELPLSIIHTKSCDISFGPRILDILNDLLELPIFGIIDADVLMSDDSEVEIVLVEFSFDWNDILCTGKLIVLESILLHSIIE